MAELCLLRGSSSSFRDFSVTFLFVELFLGPTATTLGKRDKKEIQVRRAKKKKGIEVQRVKPPSPTRTIDALIGNEPNRKQKKKKETGSDPQTQQLVQTGEVGEGSRVMMQL